MNMNGAHNIGHFSSSADSSIMYYGKLLFQPSRPKIVMQTFHWRSFVFIYTED